MGMAILNGTLIEDGGLVCEVRFDYGLTMAYGTVTPWRGGYRTGDTFQEIVRNLPAGTTIFFRAVARNAIGTTYGAGMVFITIVDAPTVATVAATNVDTGSAQLNFQIVHDSGMGCRAWFEYGGAAGYGMETWKMSGLVTGSTGGITIAGLAPGQGYYFRAVAENMYGTAYGAAMTFNTLSERGKGSGIPMELLLLREAV